MHRLKELKKRQLFFEKKRNDFKGGLNGAFCPTELLVFKSVNVFRKLGGYDQFGHIFRFPVFKLHAIGQCSISSVSVSWCQPPLEVMASFRKIPAVPVEIHEQTVPASGSLLNHEMAVDSHGLAAGNKRRLAVKMSPSTLHKAELGPINKKTN